MNKWWKKLKGWKKGLILGAVAGLIFTLLLFFQLELLGSSFEIGFLLLPLIIIIIPSILMGGVIGLLSSLTKNRFIFVGGIIGLVVGLYFEFLEGIREGGSLSWPMRLILYFYNLVTGHLPYYEDFVTRAFLFPIILVVVFSLAGILLGFVTGAIVGRFGER